MVRVSVAMLGEEELKLLAEMGDGTIGKRER